MSTRPASGFSEAGRAFIWPHHQARHQARHRAAGAAGRQHLVDREHTRNRQRALPAYRSRAIQIVDGHPVAAGGELQIVIESRKVNCMPAEGWIKRGDEQIEIHPANSLGNLDWGRGVWEYNSFWVWASASGFLPDGRTVGLNMGYGFGDTSAATENALILNGHIHKLARVDFQYDSSDFKRHWRMVSPDGRLDLEFVPFVERFAKTDLVVLNSEVHQMFGRYSGTVQADDGEVIRLDGLVGFAEEHHAKW